MICTDVWIHKDKDVIILALTHISDTNSHSFIHEVEDHDDDKVDARGSDRGGQLWRDVGANHLQVGGGTVLHDAGESCVYRQAVRNHSNDAGNDQRDLRDRYNSTTVIT